MFYAELQATSNYSFLRGASHVEELLAQAAWLELPALAITDHASMAGMARAHQRSLETGVRLVVGTRLELQDGTALLAYPTDRAAYARLCNLLTLGNSRAGKGGCRIDWADFQDSSQGVVALLLADRPDETTEVRLHRARDVLGDRAYLALSRRRRPGEAVRLARLSALAAAARVPCVATGDVLYHVPQRRVLQDVLTCIREGCRLDEAGDRLEDHAERHLRPAAEMAQLFPRNADAVARTQEIVERCRFSLADISYQYPDEILVPGRTPQKTLEILVREKAPERYPHGVPETVAAQLRHELALVGELAYAPYFLTVYTIVTYAKSQNILCQGRGSAANSAICYVLGITAIDPATSTLLFERFVSTARREPPDIDVDFEHERREEVIQWVYGRYGREHAALCATITRYRARGAIREVGKVMGLPTDVTAALAAQVWGWSEEGVQPEQAAGLNMNLSDRRLRLALDLARTLIGFPRHMGTHPGGFVLTRDRLSDLVPIQQAAMPDRQVIEWDKDDIDLLHFMKVDVLGLGMLGCLRRAFDLLEQHRRLRLEMATIPQEDAETYAMIRRADTLGTFQIESRAQMAMLPRLKPRTFYDLVIEVAVVRPGPIQGDMVHPYLRRREGREPVSFPTPELERVLGKTLGVPLFQEQAMQVAIVCAGFTPSESDQLRRSMATFKVTGGVSHFKQKMIAGMAANGYDAAFAEKLFTQIEGFGSYGFPESHATGFAMIAYASAWIKCHHPEVFCAALLNAQPMGFYAPAQIVRDAREHGVEVRPVCLNASRWDATLEPASKGTERFAVRLGLRMCKGLDNAAAAALVAARGGSPFADPADAWRRSGVGIAALERIAEADGFAGMGLGRREALWAIRALAPSPLPLFAAAEERLAEPAVALAPMPAGRDVVEDYSSLGLTLRQHPLAFLRGDLQARRVLACGALMQARDGQRVQVAGLVLVRQRPGSAKGVLFLTIEDETGIANLVVWPAMFERFRREILSAGLLCCRGRVQREGLVLHVVTEHVEDATPLLRSLGARDEFVPITGRGDEARHGGGPDRRERLPPARDLFPAPGIRVASRDFR
jgi:error-prone DNA polymerase